MEQREEFDSFQGQVQCQRLITEPVRCVLAPFSPVSLVSSLAKIVSSIADERRRRLVGGPRGSKTSPWRLPAPRSLMLFFCS